jgi:hypothetical protein
MSYKKYDINTYMEPDLILGGRLEVKLCGYVASTGINRNMGVYVGIWVDAMP